MNHSLIYITCASEVEAERIARALVEERLAAGVNLLPGARSVYRWQGKVKSAAEIVLIAQTRTDLVERLTARVIGLHSYEVPCVVAIPITSGNPAFLRWIEDETG